MLNFNSFLFYLNMDSFDNTLKINESIMKGIDNMLKYQNYQLMELLKRFQIKQQTNIIIPEDTKAELVLGHLNRAPFLITEMNF